MSSPDIVMIEQKSMTLFPFHVDVKLSCASCPRAAMNHNTSNSSLPCATSIKFHCFVLTAARNWANGRASARLTRKASLERFADAHASSSRTTVKRRQHWILSSSTCGHQHKQYAAHNNHLTCIHIIFERK